MNSTVRLLHHPTSQPCRAVHQLMLEAGIPFEQEVVNLMDGDNEQQSFKEKYNPTGQVPILCDGDFVVWESPTIAFYLNEKFDIPDNWFGATMEQRATIQQYLHCRVHKDYLCLVISVSVISQSVKFETPGKPLPYESEAI